MEPTIYVIIRDKRDWVAIAYGSVITRGTKKECKDFVNSLRIKAYYRVIGSAKSGFPILETNVSEQ